MNKSITLSMDTQLIDAGRAYAAKRGTSLNKLLRQSLEALVGIRKNSWKNELLTHLKEANGNSGGWKFNREDLYER